MTAEAVAAYLGGIVDGEGSVCNPPKPAGGARTVRIANTDPAIIEACCACCDRLNLTYRIHTIRKRKKHHKRAWVFVITTHASLKVFAARVPIVAPAKIKNLHILLGSYRRPPYEIEPTKELLHRLYVVEGKTYEQIRAHVGARSHGTVKHWLDKHGIACDRKPRHVSPSITLLKRWYVSQRLSTAAIARHCSVRTVIVIRWLRKAGISVANRGRGHVDGKPRL